MAPEKKTRSMTPEHKAALAEGRTQGNAVRAYLEALAANKPKRGRKRTPESIKKRLDAIDQELGSADQLKKLQLNQEQIDLADELATMNRPKIDISALEKGFIAAAGPYAARKEISYAAFRSVGVTPAVLNAAGISRAKG